MCQQKKELGGKMNSEKRLKNRVSGGSLHPPPPPSSSYYHFPLHLPKTSIDGVRSFWLGKTRER